MDKEKIMSEAREYTEWVYDLEEAVKVLAQKKLNNENVFINFNGKKLYSLLDDENSCYQKVTGTSKEIFEERRRKELEEWHKEEDRKRNEAISKIPEWIKRGEEFIYPQMQDEWGQCVVKRATDFYHGLDLEYALEVMLTLDQKEGRNGIEIAKKLLNEQDHSGMSYDKVVSIILNFSKRGPEFYRELYKDKKLGFNELQLIYDKENRNKMFEDELNNQK